MKLGVWMSAALALGSAGCRSVTTLGREPSDAGHDASTPPDAASDAGPDAMIFDGPYIEAEDGVIAGLTIEDQPEASGGRALLAPDILSDAMPGDARATYAFQLAEGGDYKLWGRVYAPDVDTNRFWLKLDDGAWFLWRISTGEVWYWDDVHEDTDYGTALTFTLSAGVHTFALANAGPSARIDRFYFTKDGDVPPGNDTPCRPPHTVELGGVCVPSCGLLMGTACGPVDCMGREPLPAYDCDICCQVE